MAAKKPAIAQLQAEIEALRRRVQELEARPPVVIHNHPTVFPLTVPAAPQPWWRPGEVICGVVTMATDAAPPWNGPRHPDGSCAPIGSLTYTAGSTGTATFRAGTGG